MGIVSAITIIGPTLGPIVVGGILAFTDCRSLFIVFIALVLAALVLAFVSVGDIAELANPKLDIASTCLAALNVDNTLERACTILSDKRIKKLPCLIKANLSVSLPGRVLCIVYSMQQPLKTSACATLIER